MDDSKTKRPKLPWIVCLVALGVLGLATFLWLAALSRPGIGIVGNNTDAKATSPVGTWKMIQTGAIYVIRADGTATIKSSSGEVTHVDWRLDGTEFGMFYHGAPSNMRGRLGRIFYRLGLRGDRPHDRFKLVEVTADEMSMTIDEEPRTTNARDQRGDPIEFVAVPE